MNLSIVKSRRRWSNSKANNVAGIYSILNGFNSRLSRTGGALFPMNSYDTSGEFGRSSFDIRHQFTIFGTINMPWPTLDSYPTTRS